MKMWKIKIWKNENLEKGEIGKIEVWKMEILKKQNLEE